MATMTFRQTEGFPEGGFFWGQVTDKTCPVPPRQHDFADDPAPPTNGLAARMLRNRLRVEDPALRDRLILRPVAPICWMGV